MDFYVTLPSNASMNVHPDNKKSDYTTQFNTPIVLEGNYEVALANITCTPNIKNDYGEISIDNISTFYPFLPPLKKVLINLYDVKNIEDKIIQGQEQIAFYQVFLNFTLYKVISEFGSESGLIVYNNLLPIFYNLNEINDPNPNYYIPKAFNNIFDEMCVKENVKIEDNFAVLTREQFNYLIEEKFDLYYYPIIRFSPKFTFTASTIKKINDYYMEKINDNTLTNSEFDDLISVFRKIYYEVKDSVHYTGLISLKAEIKNDQIKFNSNVDLELKAHGIIKDLVFKNEKIMLDTYYKMPGKLNLIKYGIIYCDIVQEQIVGEEYRQVLQIIPLNSTESSQVLSNNLDLQYVPVKSNFISSINISIKSLTGDLIKFDDDFIYTIVKLHFRKIL